MTRLLHSSKFWLAVLGVINTVVSHYLNIPAEVWASVDGLLVTVIASTAAEDVAEKSSR
jgi:hypothetical protein